MQSTSFFTWTSSWHVLKESVRCMFMKQVPLRKVNWYLFLILCQLDYVLKNWFQMMICLNYLEEANFCDTMKLVGVFPTKIIMIIRQSAPTQMSIACSAVVLCWHKVPLRLTGILFLWCFVNWTEFSKNYDWNQLLWSGKLFHDVL